MESSSWHWTGRCSRYYTPPSSGPGTLFQCPFPSGHKGLQPPWPGFAKRKRKRKSPRQGQRQRQPGSQSRAGKRQRQTQRQDHRQRPRQRCLPCCIQILHSSPGHLCPTSTRQRPQIAPLCVSCSFLSLSSWQALPLLHLFSTPTLRLGLPLWLVPPSSRPFSTVVFSVPQTARPVIVAGPAVWLPFQSIYLSSLPFTATHHPSHLRTFLPYLAGPACHCGRSRLIPSPYPICTSLFPLTDPHRSLQSPHRSSQILTISLPYLLPH